MAKRLKIWESSKQGKIVDILGVYLVFYPDGAIV
jgi:hypothetical protein